VHTYADPFCPDRAPVISQATQELIAEVLIYQELS
jgi:hypothetical protein